MAGIPKIVVLSEQLRGQSFELVEDSYSVGRTEDCDICIPDPTVSTHHCTLKRNPNGGFIVVDEGSTNGTRVNGAKLTEYTEQELNNSDILQVGGIEMLFDCEETRATGTSTQTVVQINTSSSDAVSDMDGFSPYVKDDDIKVDANKMGMLMISGLVMLGVILVGVLGFFIKTIFFS